MSLAYREFDTPILPHSIDNTDTRGRNIALTVASIIDHGTYRRYFLREDKKVGVITYRIQWNNTIYIEFFWTQNSQSESHEYRELQHLHAWKHPLKWLSYDLMEVFVRDVCIPNGITHIHLHADDQSKKFYWKEKIGKDGKNRWLFSRIYSAGLEITLELAKPLQ